MMLSSVALVINLNQEPVMLLTGEVFLISLQGVINTSLMEFNLTGDQWLDPSTFRVMLQLNNAGNVGAAEGSPTKALEPLSWNPAVFFRRARIICGGVVVEDIGNFNRLSLMLTALKTEEVQHPIAAEGFWIVGEKYIEISTDSRSTYCADGYDKSGLVTVSRRVLFKPILLLFHQDNLLPLRYSPIQIELELVR